jgi:hypothetical protein
MPALPTVTPQPEILDLLESVGKGATAVEAAMEDMQRMLDAIRDGSTCPNKITVLAILYVEALRPNMAGQFIPEETLIASWSQPDGPEDPHARLRMAFIVVSCLQITSILGPVREGAKKVQQAMDKILPED